MSNLSPTRRPANPAFAKVLHFIGIAEGLSLLFLFLVAMPLKYGPLKNDILIGPAGLIHGMLFLVYCAGILLAAPLLGWNWKNVLLGWVASVVPFGTFLFDAHVRKQAAAQA